MYKNKKKKIKKGGSFFSERKKTAKQLSFGFF